MYRAMRYDFLIDSYDSERVKVLSVWSEFRDDDLPVRPTGAHAVVSSEWFPKDLRPRSRSDRAAAAKSSL